MLEKNGFDTWAGDYDASIQRYSKGYPFEGYYNVLSYVQNLVEIEEEKKILDVGIGTGLLTSELYKKGGEIYGIDFSDKMIELAKLKIPNGKFYCYDFRNGLPEELVNEKFDYIVSSYAIHHITDENKIDFIKLLIEKLDKNGKIMIADIAFATNDAMEKCKEISKKAWDNDEYYMVAEDISDELEKLNLDVKYTQVSSCAGVLELIRK